MLKWHCIWLALAVCPLALANGPWDGVWFRDDAKSHLSDHTYSLAKLPNGMWQKDSGFQKYTFRMDGNPYPTLPSDFTVAVTQTSPNVLDWVSSGFGRDLQRSHDELSADGKTITSRVIQLLPDGTESPRIRTAVRVAGASGFEGTWKEQPAVIPAIGTGQTRRPTWVISTASDGMMTWYIPSTGELIRGRADGKSRPITGPQVASGTTHVWRQISPYQLGFYASVNGQLVEEAIETLSPDGKTFTDMLWRAGHDDEKDVRVYVKR